MMKDVVVTLTLLAALLLVVPGIACAGDGKKDVVVTLPPLTVTGDPPLPAALVLQRTPPRYALPALRRDSLPAVIESIKELD
jgi:hypothetical protein